MKCELHDSLPDWIIEYPETQTVFRELGLDESCGGKSLEYLCRQQGLVPEDVLHRLQQVINEQPDEPAP
ncbi:MAG: hypothetical protein CMJ46_07060 [Planctomyces sp.]|nr:hypothetical protein [Planctomyces sp.]